MHAILIALVVTLLPACAHAQEGRLDRSETPIARATANVIVHALPETQYRAWGNRWDAVSVRVSRIVAGTSLARIPVIAPTALSCVAMVGLKRRVRRPAFLCSAMMKGLRR